MPASDADIVNPKLGPPSAQFVTGPVSLIPIPEPLFPAVRWISAWTRNRREVVHERLLLNQPPRMSTECPETTKLERTWRHPLRASANEFISAPAGAAGAKAVARLDPPTAVQI